MLKQMDPTRITIDSNDFAIYPFGAFVAARVSGDLVKFAGPVVAGLMPLVGADTQDGLENLLNSDLSKVVPAVTQAFATMDGVVVEKLLMELLVDHDNVAVEYVDYNGSRVQARLNKDLANQLFVQDIAGMLRLALEVINVNYKGFFSKMYAQYGGAPLGVQSTTKPKNTESSTSPSLITLS